MFDEIDIARSIIAALTGGGGAVGAAWIVSRLRKSGWRIGLYLERVDVEALRSAAARGREKEARAEAIAREAEARVARAEALVAQCQKHTEQATQERDALALRIAKGGKHANQ